MEWKELDFKKNLMLSLNKIKKKSKNTKRAYKLIYEQMILTNCIFLFYN